MTVTAKEGKYLTFALGGEEYGLQIHQVREIIGLMGITPVPQVPSYVKGVINLRGKIIPVVDIRAKFAMGQVEYTAKTCIIVLNVLNVLMGILVDRVCDVVEMVQKDIEPAPAFNTTVDMNFILGIGKIGERVRILLDIEKILMQDAGNAAAF
ncbi:MAG TPA: chemotaxis protein CheW [Candidatus Omnitrophica bacterium]|nr:chemotaxis protein CheW [Candidatus Omnitrophota bacterium]